MSVVKPYTLQKPQSMHGPTDICSRVPKHHGQAVSGFGSFELRVRSFSVQGPSTWSYMIEVSFAFSRTRNLFSTINPLLKSWVHDEK